MPIAAAEEGSATGDEDNERQLDGTKGGHIFRDHGQFGSHPVHDDYDDESEP